MEAAGMEMESDFMAVYLTWRVVALNFGGRRLVVWRGGAVAAFSLVIFVLSCVMGALRVYKAHCITASTRRQPRDDVALAAAGTVSVASYALDVYMVRSTLSTTSL